MSSSVSHRILYHASQVSYRQQKVHDIHQAQHDIRNIVEPVDVRSSQKTTRNPMMSQHLIVILSPLLDVNDENLLHPERQLHKQIPLQNTRHAAVRPLRPDSLEVEPVGGLRPDVLLFYVNTRPTKITVGS